MSSLTQWDYVSMGVVVAGTCLVGLYHVFRAKRSDRAEGFLVANKELNIFSLVMSMVATMATSAGLTGNVMEVYNHGIIYILFSISSFIAVIIGIWLFLPIFYQLDKNTIYEYLEMRFCFKLRIGVSILQSLNMLLMSSSFLYVTGLVLNQVTELGLWASVSVIGLTCIGYTSLGGFKAVVWADVVQQIVIFTILFLLIFKGGYDVGGVGVVWERLMDSNRSDVFIWKPEAHRQYTAWTFLIGGSITLVGYTVLNQPIMQRCQSNTSLNKARLCLLFGGIVLSVSTALIAVCGWVVVGKYFDCDPLMMGRIRTRDQMLTLFAVDTLSFCDGLVGVFIAGLLCATISTLSSILNSLAAMTMSDYIRPILPDLSPRATLSLSKATTVLHGLLIIALVAVVPHFGGIMKICFSVNSLLAGPMLVIFVIGMSFPNINTKAAVIGTLFSTILPWWLIFGSLISSKRPPHLPYTVRGCSNQTDIIYDISQVDNWQWFYSISPLWCPVWGLAIGLPVSLLAGKLLGFQDSSKVDPVLLFPFVRRFIKTDEPQDKKISSADVNHQKIPALIATIYKL